jgi:hypothetical protein
VHRDITATTEWLTSNPSAATFVSPGVMKVIGTGQVDVIIKVGTQQESGRYAFAVALGTTPERLVKLSVITQDTASTPRRLARAAVHVEPDRGPTQQCVTDNGGLCYFWVFDGRIRARATLNGYEPAEGLAARMPDDNPFSQNVTLALRAIR